MADLKSINVGEYVMLNQNEEKLVIGQIEEITQADDTFTYTQYCKPEETSSGRLAYQGKNEILRTTERHNESLKRIISKVDIYKLADYAKMVKEDKLANSKFVCRQDYDPLDGNAYPELEPDCFCSKIINPDDDLVACNCGRIFHYECITNEDATCPTCDYGLMSAGEAIHKKRKGNDGQVYLKPENEEEFYDIFASTLDDIADAQMEEEPPAAPPKTLNEKRPYSQLEIKKTKSTTPKAPQPQLNKKFSRKELTNIDDEAFQSIKTAVNNFSKAHQNRNMSEIERIRYYTKEKYYRGLLYGIEEVRQRFKLVGSLSYLTEEQKTIASRTQIDNYKRAQDLALSIEATMWHALSKNKMKIDPNYTMKTREILNHLMDDNNSELRLSILIGERKPEDLCRATGKDLVSKGVSEKLEKKEKETLKQALLPENVKIIAKSHKGEEVIENEEMEIEKPEPSPKESEQMEEETEAETLAKLVNKFNRRPSDNLNLPSPHENNGPQKSPFLKANDGKSPSPLPSPHSSLPMIRRNSSAKSKYEESVKQANTGMNKLIDASVLKNLEDFFVDKVYPKIEDKLKNHLKPRLAAKILGKVKQNHQFDS